MIHSFPFFFHKKQNYRYFCNNILSKTKYDFCFFTDSIPVPPSSPTPYSRLQVHDNRLVSQSSTGSSESSLSHMTEEKPVLPGVTVRAATKENLVQLVIQSIGWCMVWEIECQFKRAEWPWQLLDHMNLFKRESSE